MNSKRLVDKDRLTVHEVRFNNDDDWKENISVVILRRMKN